MAESLSLYPDATKRLGEALECQGLTRVEHPHGRWEGELTVCWDDREAGEQRIERHRIAIAIDEGFPFRKPEVIPLSELRSGARHRAPVGSNGALCLYSERARGWLPEYSGDDLLERVREWFLHYHLDDWGTEDRAPDLHLYYYRSRSRHLAVIGESWQPPEGRSGRFGIWEGTQALVMGSPTRGHGLPTGGPPQELARNLGVRNAAYSVGSWFRLSAEPTPAEHLSDVFKDIDEKLGGDSGFAQSHIRSLAGYKPTREFRTILALGYPGASGDEEWLFLDVILPSGKSRRDRWERQLKKIRVRALETAPARASDLMRRTAHIQARLASKRVLVFGVGAVGSSTALLLAKAGVGEIEAVDGQQLRPSNCIRHEAGLRLSGFDKASAMAVVVGQHAPYCKFTATAETWDPTKLLEMVRIADLVIDATANEPFGLLLNEICLRARRPLMVVATYRRASIGRIRLVKPGENACLVCYLRHMIDAGYPLIPTGDEGEFIEAGCGDPTVQASAIDIEYISNVAAQVARNYLSGTHPNGLDECLLVVEPLEGAPEPLQRAGTHWLHRFRIAGCEACHIL